MRRLTLILVALVVMASACFGTSGSWRCANGTPCAFTPGVGFHCPTALPSHGSRTANARTSGHKCSHCRPGAAVASGLKTSSGPCASMCSGCSCHFTVVSSHVPATTANVPSAHGFNAYEFAAVYFAASVPHIGFAFRPIVFTTGPPAQYSTRPPLTTPSRAPPRLFSV